MRIDHLIDGKAVAQFAKHLKPVTPPRKICWPRCPRAEPMK
jgi:hypothetical protein